MGVRLGPIGAALAAASLLLACQGDGPLDPSSGTALPGLLRLVGDAAGSDSTGRRADCTMDLTIELREESRRNTQLVEYVGIHGGHLARTVLEPDSSGIALIPSVYGEAVATLHLPDSLELRFPANGSTGSRFWDSLALLVGTWHDGAGSGTWICAPFDITEGGWVDTALTATGSWTIEPF